jgi:hypothetical protein
MDMTDARAPVVRQQLRAGSRCQVVSGDHLDYRWHCHSSFARMDCCLELSSSKKRTSVEAKRLVMSGSKQEQNV